MKPENVLTIAAVVASLAFATNSYSQLYQFSTPITGSITLGVVDADGPSGSSASTTLGFTNLNETVYLDPGGSIRQVGTISLTTSATNLSFTEVQEIQQFPNPPQSASGTINVALSIDSGDITFDTGVQPLIFNPGDQAYTNFSSLEYMTVPISGSYSLTTGGQTYTGSFSYLLSVAAQGATNLYRQFCPWAFSILTTSNYPASIYLSDLFSTPVSGDPFVGNYIDGVASVVASNGFKMDLFPGSGCCWNGGEEESFNWASGAVSATNLGSGVPFITSQPQNALVSAYNNASFSATASGALPITYQWLFDGSNISGATSSMFTISAVRQTNLGTYSVIVSSQFGSTNSSNATLSMYPYLAEPFNGLDTYWGYTNALSVQAWGTGPLSYQWFDNGVAINGATNQTLGFTNIQFTNAGIYSVVVTSPLGSVTNTPAQVVVNPAGLSLGFSPTLTITGVIGYSYIIQSSTNLADTNAWFTLTNLTLSQSTQQWVDTNVDASSPFNSRRFYQVLPGR